MRRLPCYLERSEGTKHRFYAVAVQGTTVVLRYGRIGSQGHLWQILCDTQRQAQKEAEKKRAEKLRRGYVVMAAPSEPRKLLPPADPQQRSLPLPGRSARRRARRR